MNERNAPSLLTRHAVGLGVLLLTTVPAYLVSRPHVPSEAHEIKGAAPGIVRTTEAARNGALAAEIVAHIREVAVRYDISPPLVAAIVEAESEFNPWAVSRRGARGLMQLMPRTAAGVRVDDVFDPYENVEGGVRHLRTLMERFKGDLPLVLAAYNAGEPAVLAYGGIPPYPETRRYVVRILRRIGRADLATRVSGGVALTLATTRPTPGTWSEAWRERQALERRPLTQMDRGLGDAPRDPPRSEADTPAAPVPHIDRPDSQGP